MPRKRQTKVGKVNPVDVRSKADVSAFESLLGRGPLTIVLVYADWCGHCRTFKENMWNEVTAMPNKKVNTASVHYDQVENTSLKNAKIEGYPSLLLVGTNKEAATFKENGATTNAMPTPQSVDELKNMVNSPITTPVSNANTVATKIVNNANASVNNNTAENNMNVSSMVNNNANMNTVMNNMNAMSVNNNNSLYTNIRNTTSYKPVDAATIEVPDTSMDIPKTATVLRETEVQRGGKQHGGSETLFGTLMKITTEAGHAGGLLLAATEYADLAKRFTRKHKKRSKKTMKGRRGGK